MDDYWPFIDPNKEVLVGLMERTLDLESENLVFTQMDQLLTAMYSKSLIFLWASVFSSGKWSDWTRFERFYRLKIIWFYIDTDHYV